MKQHILTWNDVEHGISKIVSQIYDSQWRPEVIYGIARGGLIPAVMLAHKLNINNMGNTITHNGPSPTKLLVVDEICDSGNTFNSWPRYPYYRYCALVNNIGGHNIFKDVSYYGIEINKEKDPSWIIFPWEI